MTGLRSSFWKPPRVTRRKYPYHGTPKVMGGLLKGETDTDYFHFFCPNCGDDETLDAELLEVDTEAMVIVIGLHCQKCKLTDLMKIGVLERRAGELYQPRPVCRKRK